MNRQTYPAAALPVAPPAAKCDTPPATTVSHDNTSGPETPVQTAFRKWKAAQDYANGPAGTDNDAALGLLEAAEGAVIAPASQSAADVAAKIVAITNDDVFGMGETDGPNNAKLWAEIRSLTKGRASAETLTSIHAAYQRWKRSLDEFTALDTQWRAGDLTDARFEELCEPILAERDRIEAEMFDGPCTCIADLNMLVLVAAYYDWLVDIYNDGVHHASVRLASNWPVDE